MKVSSLLTLLSATSLVTAARKTSGLCTKSSSVVSAISNPSGSAFCASLLGIPQTVVTSTSTIQRKARTVMKTARVTDTTATVTKTITTRSTTTVTNVVTTQSTETDTITQAALVATDVDCVSATDQFKPYTTTVADSDEIFRQINDDEDEESKRKGKGRGGRDEMLQKRDTAPAALKGQSKRRRNAFCNCLSLQPGTTTVTTTTRIKRTTVTSTTTSTISAKTVTKGTATTTITKQKFSTSTLDPTTTTMTVAIVTPTPATYAGVNYYAFHNEYNYNLADPGFDATEWESNDYELSGLLQEINDEHTQNYPSGSNVCSMPDGDFDGCTQSTFVNQGFLHAITDGTYVVASDNTIDNGMYVWSGDNAYSGYNNKNMDYEAVRAGGGPYFGGSQTYELNAGDLIPFTIMAVNGGGPGRAILSITTPDGTTTGSDGHFMPACPNNSPFSP